MGIFVPVNQEDLHFGKRCQQFRPDYWETMDWLIFKKSKSKWLCVKKITAILLAVFAALINTKVQSHADTSDTIVIQSACYTIKKDLLRSTPLITPRPIKLLPVNKGGRKIATDAPSVKKRKKNKQLL